MQLKLAWNSPLTLVDASDEGLIYNLPPNKLPINPGIYVFGRLFGKNLEALYVGKAGNIKQRTQQQFKNLKLMIHLKNAKAGRRVLMAGVLNTKSQSKIDKGLPVLEKALIRYFLAEGHDLVNVQGTKIRRHEILSTGSSHIPETMFVNDV